MKKTIMIILLLTLIAAPILAGNGWETNLTVSAGPASSRLSFGQQADATGGLDGRYDVPAMLSGDLQARFTDGGGTLWRDIRSTDGNQEWQLAVEAAGPVILRWDPAGLPSGSSLTLEDSARGKSIDMATVGEYAVTASGTSEFMIRLK
ncbi:MAG: hypothetical protein KJ950_10415 [Proteobacteria bacterium]|nr:hypothetical protein [Pseudomonadota bacterium]MBU1687523.1 hypothetical protein [Pseudomonadota bacterium]